MIGVTMVEVSLFIPLSFPLPALPICKLQLTMSCQFIRCSKKAYPGSHYCSISHCESVISLTTSIVDSNCVHPSHADICNRWDQGQMSCQFPGCSKSVYPGSSYCSWSHREYICPSNFSQNACWNKLAVHSKWQAQLEEAAKEFASFWLAQTPFSLGVPIAARHIESMGFI